MTVSATTNSITGGLRCLQCPFIFVTSGTRLVSPAVSSLQLAYHVL